MTKKITITALVIVALAALVYVAVPDARDEAQTLPPALLEKPGQQEKIALAIDGLDEVPITASNASVGFACAKTLAGKTVVVRGGWSGKFGSKITGTIGMDPNTHEPAILRAEVRIDSLWSEHDDLTDALLTKGFFDPQPSAVFHGTFVDWGRANVTGSTAVRPGAVTGTFELNGITRWITFPVDAERSDASLVVTSRFSLDRHAFNVRFTDAGGYGLLTDDNIADRVAIELRIDVPPRDGSPTEAAPTPAAEAREVDPEPVPPVEDWPASFTETIRSTQIDFDMVLVPAVADSGQPPFYIGRHEVTWDEFMPWVQGTDLERESIVGEQRALKLRPSSPYGSVDRNFGMYRRPALGMSRLSAERYCEWLSEQTGRRYRLPTEAEWEHAYAAGGGDPTSAPSRSEAERIATYHGNAWDDAIGDWATTRVGRREANGLGIHDLAGNVAEWVTGTGEERVVRGGHFESPLEDLVVGRIVEDAAVWNRDYPNEPKSEWWYVNARWVGFRVVCEAPPSDNRLP